MRLLLLFLFTFLVTWARADGPPPPPSAPEKDPAQLSHHLVEVLSRPEFQNIEEPSYDTRMEDWFRTWILNLGAGMTKLQYTERLQSLISLLTTTFVLLTVAGLIYIIVRLFRRRRWDYAWPQITQSRPQAPPTPAQYEDAIARAVRSQNWQEAWLSTWRLFLARLEIHQWVETDRTRTNREYLYQVLRHTWPAPVPPLLVNLVQDYDFYIYGRHPITEKEWSTFRQQVHQVSRLMNLEGRARETP